MSASIAIVGANGFIGTRLVEYFHLGELAQVRPIVRRVNALAGLSRFDLDSRIADARDADGMQGALAGCEAVVHCVAGDAATIEGAVGPVYQAAQHAGVRRIVYLSSASVHGQAPMAGTDEDTPLRDDQPIAYNNARVRAERELLRRRRVGPVEVVILRPGIVTGPRSFWITSFAKDLLAGHARLVDRGRGVCNSIYVDNLAHAIRLAIDAPGADGQSFLLGDAETVTWADVYRPIAQALSVCLESLPDAVYRPRRTGLRERLESLQYDRRLGPMVARIPKRLRRIAYAALLAGLTPAPESESVWAHPDWTPAERMEPECSLESYLLGTCAYKLPDRKARAMLGYAPAVSFDEGMRRTLGWLRFAGYPIDFRHER